MGTAREYAPVEKKRYRLVFHCPIDPARKTSDFPASETRYPLLRGPAPRATLLNWS